MTEVNYPKCFETFVRAFRSDGTLSRAEALNLAAQLVGEVRATLDVSKTDACPACGLQKFAEWEESQAWTQLKAAEAKLGYWAKKL